MSGVMNYYLTGSKGFIGSHLKRRLESEGHLDCMSNPESTQCDIVFHLAAVTHLRTDFDPQLFESNIIYAKQMLTTPYRTIFASSTSAATLDNPYSYTKRYGEYLCSQHPNALALRLFNVYGIGCRRGIVQRMLEAKPGSTINIQGGAQVRDFIHVDDVVTIIMQHLTEGTGIIDVGTGEGISMVDLVRLFNSISGKRLRINLLASEQNAQKYSVAKTQPKMDYTDLRTGLTRVVEEYESLKIKTCKTN